MGRTGTPAPAMVALAASFEPMASMTSGGGPTKTSPAASAGPGEGGVLGQEPVAGVDGVGPAGQGRRHQGVAPQVGLGRGGPGQADHLVGLGHVGGTGVGIGADGHAVDAQAWALRMIRRAISPRLATRSLVITGARSGRRPGHIRNTP